MRRRDAARPAARARRRGKQRDGASSRGQRISAAWADSAQDSTEVKQVAADPYRSAFLADLAAGRDESAASASSVEPAGPHRLRADRCQEAVLWVQL